MGSFRQKPVGWRYDSRRHSLAAKGISSRQYMMSQEQSQKLAGMMKGMLSDGRPETPEYDKVMRSQLANEQVMKISREAHELEAEGKLRRGDADRFITGDLTDKTKDFLNNTLSYGEYKKEVDRLWERYKTQNNTTLSFFG